MPNTTVAAGNSAGDRIVPVCVVTGGSSGIGLATLHRFAEAGYRVATCARDQQRLASAQQQIKAIARDTLFVSRDLSDPEQACQLASETIAKFGRIDVLVNNAAMAPLAPFDEISHETFEQTLSVNVRSVFYLTQQVWHCMKQQGSGVVVNISSLAAKSPFPGFSLYGSTKAWLDLMTVALADEGATCGIRVYSIRPGAVETPMLRRLFPEFPGDQCVSPGQVAQSIWRCVQDPGSYKSGGITVISNQPSES